MPSTRCSVQHMLPNTAQHKVLQSAETANPKKAMYAFCCTKGNVLIKKQEGLLRSLKPKRLYSMQGAHGLSDLASTQNKRNFTK